MTGRLLPLHLNLHYLVTLMQVAVFVEAEELYFGRIVMEVLKLAETGWQDLRHFSSHSSTESRAR